MFRPTTWWDRLFLLAIFAKGLDGLAEVVGAIGLLVTTPGQLLTWTRMLVAPELSEDPDDVIATHLLHIVGGMSAHAQLFAVAYLLVHGLVKLVLVSALLRDRIWAYPWMIAVLLAFIGYHVYRITLTPSAGLIALTVFDAVIVVLVIYEYRHHRRRVRTRVGGGR